jgi:ribonuclease P protein component
VDNASRDPARAGFVVSRKVGNAVVRNRVRRRLREQVRTRLDGLPPGTMMVVRALPDSATASSAELGRALDRALRQSTSPRSASPARAARSAVGARAGERAAVDKS